MKKIKIKILDRSIPLPKYAHTGDAGLDLYSSINCGLRPFERKKIPTGIKISIPQGYAGFIQPRSGLAAKYGISIVNTPGLIDSGYRGEVCAILINLDPKNTFKIKKGDKICQLVIHKVEEVNLEIVEDLGKTSRGESGFGSTGK
ncbi:MAG: dUTP diphosphatase [Actinomycetia bacterium]|nr:dUTP diphosphatase [Actinomycetota bacterium]MCG2790579.1 dUTP diphosphatase [Actinomycetes bacterium]